MNLMASADNTMIDSPADSYSPMGWNTEADKNYMTAYETKQGDKIRTDADTAGYLDIAGTNAMNSDIKNRLAGLDARTAPTMTAAMLGAAPTSNAAASMVGNTNIDTGPEAQYRNQQMDMMRRLQMQANGMGPSVAGAQLAKGNDASLAGNMAMLGSAHGNINPMASLRGAANNTMSSNANLANQQDLARTQEMLSAQNMLGDVTAAGRTGDQSTALAQASLNQQSGMANQNAMNQFGLSQSLSNQAMAGKYGLTQGQMNQDASTNNLGASLQTQNLNNAQSRFLYGNQNAKSEADRQALINKSQSDIAYGLGQQQRQDALNRYQDQRTASYFAAGAAGAGSLVGGVGSSKPKTGTDTDLSGYLDDSSSSDERAKEAVKDGTPRIYDLLDRGVNGKEKGVSFAALADLHKRLKTLEGGV